MPTNDASAGGRVRWGILSSANIGVKAVAPAILASTNGQLVAVGSRNPREAKWHYAFAPQVRIESSYERLLGDPEIDAIYNPLPNSLHAEWTIKALRAGKHVLCEKPFAVTTKEGAEMVQAARENDRLLMEAFMYRFHPQTVWVIEQIRAGVIGDVRQVRASFTFNARTNPQNIRLQASLAGGSLMDVGCYPVNLCRAIYGHTPIAVAARVYSEEPGDVDLATNAILDFGDGRFGLIDSSIELPSRQIAEVIGEQGTITIPVPFTPGTSETVVFLTKNGRMQEQSFPRVDQYQLEVEHFARCILSGEEPSLRVSETLENVATVEAIYRAAGQNWPPLK